MKRLMIFVMLASLPLLAQAPRSFFPWWDSPVAKDLSLSEEQSRQIRTIVREYRGRMIEQRAAVERAEVELEELYGDENFNQPKAREAAERLVAARGGLTRSMSEMGIRLRAVLTPAQYKELEKRRQIGPGGRMRGPQQRRGGWNQQPPPGGPAQPQQQQ